MPPDTVFNEVNLSSDDEDSDFAPDAGPVDDAAESDSDVDDANGAQKASVAATKRRTADDEAEDIGLENSGDEAVVSKGIRRRKKKGAAEEEDEGGEGGLVKTRSMRAIEKAERKPLLSTAEATVDVEALWSSMISKPLDPRAPTPDKENLNEVEDNSKSVDAMEVDPNINEKLSDPQPSDTITIKRTYNFAGKVHVEEKVVPRDSAEAKLWLESQGENPEAENDDMKPRRPLKKLRRSIFEPISEPLPQRTDLNFAVAAVVARAAQLPVNAKKLNTVEKSRMDWAGYVDKEGIRDELAVAGKAKSSFMNQQDFLARVEQKKEEEARAARMAKLNA